MLQLCHHSRKSRWLNGDSKLAVGMTLTVYGSFSVLRCTGDLQGYTVSSIMFGGSGVLWSGVSAPQCKILNSQFRYDQSAHSKL